MALPCCKMIDRVMSNVALPSPQLDKLASKVQLSSLCQKCCRMSEWEWLTEGTEFVVNCGHLFAANCPVFFSFPALFLFKQPAESMAGLQGLH